MNSKLMLKTVFLILVLFLLVYMGMHNQKPISFSLPLPPLIRQDITQPAAFMYLGFFAIGLITGTVLTAGGKKGGGSGGSSKSSAK